MNNVFNLQKINQEEALNLTKFYIKSNQNFFLFGQRGTGKTEITIRAAKECNLKVNYINLSVIERPDLAGYPDMKSEGDLIKFKSPQFLPPLLDNQEPDSVILFDEVDKAPPEITAPLLEILQFKKINGKPINACACILTGNLMNEGAYSNQISTALLDRGAKYILSFDFEKWIEWSKANDIHDLIIGFLKNNPEFACGKAEDTSYASPSPRGWTLASNALIKAKELKIVDIETVSQIISGFVGYEAGIRFKIWYEHYKRFEPYIVSLIENSSMNIDYHELSPTEKIVFVISACFYAKQKTIKEINKPKPFLYLENLCKFMQTSKVENEIQVVGMSGSFDFDLIVKYKFYSCKMFFDLFNTLTENITFKK